MLAELGLAFLKIGCFSIGGGYAVIPLIQEQVVEQKAWVSQRVFTDIITISQMTPGPLAVNTSTFVGLQIEGIAGAVTATVCCVIGGVLLSLLMACFFRKYRSSEGIFEMLKGLKASSLGLIVSAAATILLLTFFETSDMREAFAPGRLNIRALLLFTAAFFAVRTYKAGPVQMMLACGALGLFCYL